MKSKNKIRINFCGTNSNSVTGSCTHIDTGNEEILLECGLYQSNNIKKDYQVNSSKFTFKPKHIDYVFLNHVHIDHSGKIPTLYTHGCDARLICPKGTKQLLKTLLLDSAYIIERDCEVLNKNYKMKATPYYSKEDVFNALEHIDEYDFNVKNKLNENISFRFVPSGHIISAGQLELWINKGTQTKKILYTSDLGNSIPKYYTLPFQPVNKANLVIGESTYAESVRQVTIKDRKKDLEKIQTVIDEVCVVNKSKVLFPTFSLDRTQNILTHLYDIYKNNSKFTIPIIIDSPLATQLTEIYTKLLPTNESEYLKEVLSWENVHIVDNYEESMYWQHKKSPMIVLAASGFMQAGRSRTWAKTILVNPNSHIVFIGFATENSLAGKLKKNKTKTVSIDNKSYACRCGITNLYSFSSHMQHDDLLKYYSDIICDKVCLVHGEYGPKCNFSKELQEEINRKNRTSKVVATNKSTSILL